MGLANLGVDVFFALSGFLIARNLFHELRQHNKIDFGAFYIRRFFRIAPVYYLALVVGFGLIAVASPHKFSMGFDYAQFSWSQHFFYYPLFLVNFGMDHLVSPNTLSVLWSISLEEQFYVCIPFLLLWAFRAARIEWLFAIVLMVALATRYTLASKGLYLKLHYNIFSHSDHLIMGVAWAAMDAGVLPIQRWLGRRVSGRRASYNLTFLTLASLAAVGISYGWATSGYSSTWQWMAGYFFSAIACMALVGSLAKGPQPTRFLSTTWLTRLGRRSYAAYVFHVYALTLAWWFVARFTDNVLYAAPLRAGLAIALAFLFAEVVHHFVEKPMNRAKANALRKLEDLRQPKHVRRPLLFG